MGWRGGGGRGHARPAVEGDPPGHAVAGPVPSPGAPVQAVEDWEHRYAVMRHHTALHVLSGVVYHLFGASVTGGQIYPDRARMDWHLETIRVVEIEGFDAQADGGTHVGNTAEVSRLVVTGTENKGR